MSGDEAEAPRLPANRIIWERYVVPKAELLHRLAIWDHGGEVDLEPDAGGLAVTVKYEEKPSRGAAGRSRP